MASWGRECIHCGARMSRLAERCPSCDGRNDPEIPWYAYAIGIVLVLLAFLGLGDPGALVDFVARLIGGAQS
jgi:hypothetical protein